MGDQVLLITSLVAVEDDLLGGDRFVVVADVEQIADFIEQHGLALLFGNIFANDDHPITVMAGGWLVFELSNVFVFELQMNVAALAN
ncbi:MAG: hypothetical protein ACKPJJ_06145, partial [Planctomycetaceae bacterium]